MMEALGSSRCARAPNGMNRNAPDAANYDESKAKPYPNLPDPRSRTARRRRPPSSGGPRAAGDRRGLRPRVYGRVPKDVPKVTWEVTEHDRGEVGDVPVIAKRLMGHVDNSRCPEIKVDIQLTLMTPADAKGPVPVMMEFGFGGRPRPGGPGRRPRKRCPAPKGRRSSGFRPDLAPWSLPRAGATPSSSPTASRRIMARD